MEKIKCYRQSELDSAVKQYGVLPVILFGDAENPAHVKGFAHVEIGGNHAVVAYSCASVEAFDCAFVEGHDNAKITLHGNSTAIAVDKHVEISVKDPEIVPSRIGSWVLDDDDGDELRYKRNCGWDKKTKEYVESICVNPVFFEYYPCDEYRENGFENLMLTANELSSFVELVKFAKKRYDEEEQERIRKELDGESDEL